LTLKNVTLEKICYDDSRETSSVDPSYQWVSPSSLSFIGNHSYPFPAARNKLL
jgi:hypothetical protein